MAGDCFAPIDICGAQFNRLDCDGALLEGTTDVVVACELVDIKVTPQLIEADRKVSRNGGGTICAQRTAPARVEGYDVVLTLCPRIDAELMELLNVYDLVIDTVSGDSVGIKDGAAGNPCNCITSPCQNPGVSVLVWSNNTGVDGISSTKPYSLLALPRVRFDPAEFMISGEYTNLVLNGKTEPNPQWIDPSLAPLVPLGPGNIYPETVTGLTGAFALWDTVTAPPGGCTCSACGYDSGLVGIGV
jgi:hypothetical protein